VPADCGLAKFAAELEQFAVNAGGAPEWVGEGSFDVVTDLVSRVLGRPGRSTTDAIWRAPRFRGLAAAFAKTVGGEELKPARGLRSPDVEGR
jgi:hypothetical protein